MAMVYVTEIMVKYVITIIHTMGRESDGDGDGDGDHSADNNYGVEFPTAWKELVRSRSRMVLVANSSFC